MGIDNGSKYNNTEKPLKYWAQLAAIRVVMRDASDPATVLDALFEPITPLQTRELDGRVQRPPTGNPMGRPKSD